MNTFKCNIIRSLTSFQILRRFGSSQNHFSIVVLLYFSVFIRHLILLSFAVTFNASQIVFFFALPTSNTQTVIANTVCPTFYANSVQFHSHTFIQVSWGFFVVVAKCIKQNRTEQNILYGIGIHSIVLCFFFLIHRFAIVFVLYSFSFCCFLSARKQRKNKWYILKANKRTNQGMNKRMNNNCC